MAEDRVYSTLEDLLALRFAGRKLSIDFNRTRIDALAGGHVARRRGQGLDFAEHRIYQPGDEPRNIDWRLTARRAEPYVRVYNEDRETPLWILVDQRPSLFFGSRRCFKSVQAVETAALLLWAGLKANDRVGGMVMASSGLQPYAAVRENRHALRFLKGLVAANQELRADTPFDAGPGMVNALYELRRRVRPGDICCLISDWLDFDDETALALQELKPRAWCLGVRIHDAMEAELPLQSLRISDGHRPLQLQLQDAELRAALEQTISAQTERLRATFRGLKLPLLELATHDDPSQALARLAARPGQRRPTPA